MATTADIRNGLCIEWNNDLYQIVEFQHVKPGKGNAFVRTKLKSLTTGKSIDNTFPSGHKIDTARVERRRYQYLYKDDMGYHFMNNETFEQVSLPEEKVANPDFLKESGEVELVVHAETENILSCELVGPIVMEVTYTEPGIRGDTATNANKPATLETGAEINVPLFINQGDFIKVDPMTRSYMERVKN